jgi:hypothetical protein
VREEVLRDPSERDGCVTYRHRLPPSLAQKAARFEEFANGGAQVTARLKDGRIMHRILISNSSGIVAMRDHKVLPFAPEDIEDIYQSSEDRNPTERGGWEYWDQWQPKSRT